MVKFTPTISQTEQKLSNELKKFGLNPKSQFKVKRRDKDYSYYIDIAFPDKKIAVEIDGPHHLDRGYEDERKDEYLKSEGWKVFRYPSDEIFQNTSAYVKKIKKIVEKTKSKTYPDQLTHTHKIIQEGLLNYGVRFEKSTKNKPKIEIYSDKPQKINLLWLSSIILVVILIIFIWFILPSGDPKMPVMESTWEPPPEKANYFKNMCIYRCSDEIQEQFRIKGGMEKQKFDEAFRKESERITDIIFKSNETCQCTERDEQGKETVKEVLLFPSR